ncbi:hypothetical protein [Desulfopila sp. IMCC35008]|uniref:hypothetical protein n=1 Tax=Desulfopila sp. IMCC35008 TaxID=2653858 RepID=UPI0013D11BB8|nr:hypothetical protein [Desulfopila sp. IMCC35008]
MALINLDSALQEALRIITTRPIGSGIELMSYKRNRSVALIRTSNNRVIMKEKGYVERNSDLELTSLKKTLKTAISREFPRSRKIRFHRFNDVAELERIHQKI